MVRATTRADSSRRYKYCQAIDGPSGRAARAGSGARIHGRFAAARHARASFERALCQALPPDAARRQTKATKAASALHTLPDAGNREAAFDRLTARWERMPPIPTVYVSRQIREERDYLTYAPALLVVVGLAFIATALHKRARPVVAARPTAPVARPLIAGPTSTTPIAMWLKKNETPELSWKPVLKDAVVELSTHADFRDIVMRETVSGNRLRVTRPIEDGRYYWRLNGGRPAELTLSRNEPPHILAPLPGQVIDMPTTVASVPLTFAWRCKPGQSVYRVQLSELPNFLSVLKDVVISGCQWPDVSMFPGAHYLRVRTEVPAGGNSEWSAPVPFRVQSN